MQTTIVQWPDTSGSLEGATDEKVPTELVYEGLKCKWGFEIPESVARHQWFKMDLDPAHADEVSHLAIEYPDPNALPISFSKSAVKLAKDYLTCLREHITKVLKTKLGEVVVDTTRIEYIITVPAIWSDAAQYHTRSCAKEAGMGDNIRIVSEPEAAVIYALDAMDPHNLRVGDTFVLCDAGGGTVDLISYTVLELVPTVKIRETGAGSGDRCGSTFLNRIFRKWLEDNFSDHEGWDDDTLEEALHRFEENAKRKFCGGPEDILISVPGLVNDRGKRVMRGKLTMSSKTMKNIWQPVIATITTLVKAQIRMTKNARAVLLVGGFGQSPYLRECIKKVVGPKVEVMQPAKGWTAVVRGALIKGLSDASPAMSRINIASRVARKAYGIRAGVVYKPDVHEKGRRYMSFFIYVGVILTSYRYWDGFDGEYQIEIMNWFVKKASDSLLIPPISPLTSPQGDTVEEDSPLETHWSRHQLVSEGRFRTADVWLFAYFKPKDDQPPLYPCSGMLTLLTCASASC